MTGLNATVSTDGTVVLPGRPVHAGGRLSSAWAFAAVLMLLVLVVGVPIGYIVIQAARGPGRLGTALSSAAVEMMRPKLTINEIVVNSVADLKKQSKLVVFQADMNADVTRQESASSWGMYWGTNVARVIARDAHVYFVVDFSQMGTSDYQYNENAKVLTVTVPRPKIDTEMVAIDPGKIETQDLRGGWMRWDKQETKSNAVAELKPKVIMQAQSPWVQRLAGEAGIESVTKLMEPLAQTLKGDGVEVRVAYRE